MRIGLGIDIAKDTHWVTALDESGTARLDRAVQHSEGESERLPC
jgi:hypothetical protein